MIRKIKFLKKIEDKYIYEFFCDFNQTIKAWAESDDDSLDGQFVSLRLKTNIKSGSFAESHPEKAFIIFATEDSMAKKISALKEKAITNRIEHLALGSFDSLQEQIKRLEHELNEIRNEKNKP